MLKTNEAVGRRGKPVVRSAAVLLSPIHRFPIMPNSGTTSTHAVRGIVYSLIGVFLLTASDGAVKWVTDTLPFGQALFIRTSFVLIPIALIVWHGGRESLRIVSPRNLLVRALLGTSSTFLIVASLSVLPIAEVLTLVFLTPIFVTALAPLLLGEHVGWHRWAAVFIGFIGAVIMLRPGTETFQIAALLPLAAALIASFRDIVTRRISATESSVAILTFSVFGMLAASLATVAWGWLPITWEDVAIAALSGVLFGAAHYLMIEGYRLAEASLVAPVRYSNLIWAPMIGFILWGELPSLWLLAGAPLIASGGLYIVFRERQLARRST